MTEETVKPSNAVVRFKWANTSPEPHDVTMRNSLEPENVFVEVLVPMTKEYLANSEDVLEARNMTIKASLSPDIESAKDEPVPILTVEGMRYVFSQLSLGNNEFDSDSPIEDDLDDEDWDSNDAVSDEDDDFDSENDDFDDDEDWDK